MNLQEAEAAETERCGSRVCFEGKGWSKGIEEKIKEYRASGGEGEERRQKGVVVGPFYFWMAAEGVA